MAEYQKSDRLELSECGKVRTGAENVSTGLESPAVRRQRQDDDVEFKSSLGFTE